MLAQPQWQGLVDDNRIAFVGHSFGGFTGVSLAGGVWDAAAQQAACERLTPKDLYCTGFGETQDPGVSREGMAGSFRDARFKAFYIMASGPSGGFSPASLASIRVPFFVDTAQIDEILAPDVNSSALAKAIPSAREVIRPAGHFTYVPICVPRAGRAPAEERICADPPGVDGRAAHRDVEADVVKFFNTVLQRTTMTSIALWSCFAAVLAGLLVVSMQNWQHYGRDRRVATFLGGWFVFALAGGLFAMLTPGLRLPPLATPVVVASLTIIVSQAIVWYRPARQASLLASLPDWYRLQEMRLYFGAVIVLGSYLNLLPRGFALSAGLGDIAVGAAALALGRLPLRSASPASMAIAWIFSGVGIVDLINAGRLGGVLVAPWLVEQQLPGFLLMLPCFGVPIMLANHVQTIGLLLRSRNAGAAV